VNLATLFDERLRETNSIMIRGQWEYNPTMLSSTIVRVRIPPLLDLVTYISLVVMSLLAARGLPTLQAQLLLLGLCATYGLLYHFIFRAGRYEKNPVLYFGPQFIILVLLLLLQAPFVDGINFIFLMVSIHAALVLTRNAATLWIAAYFLAVSVSMFITRGTDGFYAVLFYLVVYVICGVFGHILQQADLARQHNQQLIEELKSTQRKLQELAVVEERNRLARDLHDSVKQQVFAISMQLSAARTALSESEKSYQSIVEAERLAQQAGAELTTLIQALRPPRLERKTLADAIHEHVKEWTRQNNIDAMTNIDSTITVNPQTEQALFRVFQEALANAARHSQADTVTVTLKSENDEVILVVQDNGIGYDADRITRGIGLESMRERLAAVTGDLEIFSLQSQGTRVVATVRRS
jgi:signal transduction histidine kinase